ncbi:DNA-binding transcriptional regulator, MarR family [Brevibacterium aurantiacum]|uniref:DNA-binding transcriptional regulator, MarR family n=1 Tax=Brevibacterium aurantiacum TaxID=273384 RepID=A0A2H1IRK1_BREAU|nr:MarR family transcriptional regulator [Brevibacterium aurantiacum]SMX77816.1 DNA-binding transcriptional regulator, MarR family [Brevibacterium aurantiacum]
METSSAGSAASDRLIDAITDWVQQLIRMNALVAAGSDLIPTDLHCLHVLQQTGPTTTGKLGEQVGLSAGAASRMIDRLESTGFVERSRDISDRRKVTVSATVSGLQRAGAAYGGLTARTRQDLEGFSASELDVLMRFVAQSVRSVEAAATSLAAGHPSPE